MLCHTGAGNVLLRSHKYSQTLMLQKLVTATFPPPGMAPAGFICSECIQHLVFSTTATGWLEGREWEEWIQRAQEMELGSSAAGKSFQTWQCLPTCPEQESGQGTMTAAAWQRDVSPAYWELNALHEIHNSAAMSSPTSLMTSTHRAESSATVFNLSRKVIIPSASTLIHSHHIYVFLCCHKNWLKYSAHFCEYN